MLVMETPKTVQNMDLAVCISHNTKILGNRMYLTIIPSAMDKF